MVNTFPFSPISFHSVSARQNIQRSIAKKNLSTLLYQSNNESTQLANIIFSPENRYFGRKPTSVTSESNVRIGESAMPWEQTDESGKVYKYQYHPHGDKSQPLRNAPSALNTVIVPNVTLPVVFTAPPPPCG